MSTRNDSTPTPTPTPPGGGDPNGLERSYLLRLLILTTILALLLINIIRQLKQL